MTAARITQAVVETLTQVDPAARLTQNVVETASNVNAAARVTQDVIETISSSPAAARLTESYVETLSNSLGAARLTEVYVEVLSSSTDRIAVITQAAISEPGLSDIIAAAVTAVTGTIDSISEDYSDIIAGTQLYTDVYFMRAWDPDNSRFCFWLSSSFTSTPGSTEPASTVANLEGITLIHVIPGVVSYFMRAWDPDNSRYAFWVSTSATDVPVSTEPASTVANLTDYTIIEEM